MLTSINSSDLHNFWGVVLFLLIISNFCINVHAKSYTTEVSVILEGDPPELPGPSIFDYRDPNGSAKVKRGNKEQQRYYELAGDEIYIFEPSPMGAQPFMDALFPNQEQEDTQPRRFYHREKIRQSKVSRIPKKRPFIRPPPPKFEILEENIQQVTPEDAIVPKILTSASSNPNNEGNCVSANDKEGQCVPFKACYPVVFNMIDGQLRNPELAKILYLASGACDKHDTWITEQRGIISNNNNLDIPEDYYNLTVCCPGFYFFESVSHEQGSKSMKPSYPDPILYVKPPPSLPNYYPSLNNKEKDTGEEDSEPDYYFDEIAIDDEDSIFNITDIPKINPKVNNNSTTTNSSLSESQSTNTSNHAESNLSEVQVEGEDSDAKTREEESESEKVTEDDAPPKNIHIMKSQGPVPVIVKPPHLSAWNCPGREINLPRHWPWMVAILHEGNHICSGSLIDHRYVLTSATCMAKFKGKDLVKIRVILGDRVLYSSIDGPHIWRKVLRITKHLQYNPGTMENDIAILEMNNPVTYTPKIQPINLPALGKREHSTKGIVSGWSGADIGKRFFTARATSDGVVEFMDVNECREKYDGFLSKGMPNDIICTKPSNSSCMADPGGPLMMKTGNCWHLIGIMAQGLGCGSFPELFTDIAHHIPWIQKNIRHHFQVQDNFVAHLS